MRRWRKQLLARETRNQLREARQEIRRDQYDYVIDSQGLLKSALLARQAYGQRIGFDRSSARESLASHFYDHCVRVATELHAVSRNRALAAAALGYTASGAPDYGLQPIVAAAYASATENHGSHPEVVFLTATSRDDKLWNEDLWIGLGMALRQRGLHAVLPSGSTPERQRAERIAAAIPDARALQSLTLTQLAHRLAGAQLVVGVDTGLVHLAAALGRPTIALFCASNPTLTGVLAGAAARNLGSHGQSPDLATVLATATELLG